jgi:hypothetical protein
MKRIIRVAIRPVGRFRLPVTMFPAKSRGDIYPHTWFDRTLRHISIINDN